MARLAGTYEGVVEDATDPEGEGRLFVRVPAAVDAPLWAAACLPPVSPALLRLPAVGATVWVQFEDADPTRPVWTGVTWRTVIASSYSPGAGNLM